MYRKMVNEHLVVVAVYVDDLFVTGSNKEVIMEFKQRMASKFDMRDLGLLTYYLGIEVCQHIGGIVLNQRRYALKILEDAGMDKCNMVQTPIEAGLKLSKADGEREVDTSDYRRKIGCIRYLLHTRPNMSYCVGVLSRFMHCPTESHGVAIKQCLRYLRGTTCLPDVPAYAISCAKANGIQ